MENLLLLQKTIIGFKEKLDEMNLIVADLMSQINREPNFDYRETNEDHWFHLLENAKQKGKIFFHSGKRKCICKRKFEFLKVENLSKDSFLFSEKKFDDRKDYFYAELFVEEADGQTPLAYFRLQYFVDGEATNDKDVIYRAVFNHKKFVFIPIKGNTVYKLKYAKNKKFKKNELKWEYCAYGSSLSDDLIENLKTKSVIEKIEEKKLWIELEEFCCELPLP